MAGEATYPDLINGSLAGILSELEQDKTFLKLAAGDIEASDDVDNSVLAGIPEGLRPALAAAIGQGVTGKPGKPVVLTWENGKGLSFSREIAVDEALEGIACPW